jgi:hypothetical protein
MLNPLHSTGNLASMSTARPVHFHRAIVYRADCDEWYAYFDGQPTTAFGGETPTGGRSHERD